MTTHQIYVKSLHCGSCLNEIKNILQNTKGVTRLTVDQETSQISVSGDMLEKDKIVESMGAGGYHQNEETGMFSKANPFDFWYCHCCSSCDS